jgi:hypothetical protein
MPRSKEVFMKRGIAVISLGLGLITASGVASAQQSDVPVIISNGSGDCVTAPTVSTTGVSAGDWTITCGDINPGPGMTVIGPPGASHVSDSAVGESGSRAAPEPAPAADPAPEPVAEPAPDTTDNAAPADTAVATATDLDADNFDDAAEIAQGLDPSNPDTDGDGVADGDEGNIYGTAPLTWDSDGDGISDGEELFGVGSDPLVSGTNGSVSTDIEPAAGTDPSTVDTAAPEAASLDNDLDRLPDADEAAMGTDAASPDSDGDGYYDGDEVNLGTDPLDPTIYPAPDTSTSST